MEVFVSPALSHHEHLGAWEQDITNERDARRTAMHQVQHEVQHALERDPSTDHFVWSETRHVFGG